MTLFKSASWDRPRLAFRLRLWHNVLPVSTEAASRDGHWLGFRSCLCLKWAQVSLTSSKVVTSIGWALRPVRRDAQPPPPLLPRNQVSSTTSHSTHIFSLHSHYLHLHRKFSCRGRPTIQQSRQFGTPKRTSSAIYNRTTGITNKHFNTSYQQFNSLGPVTNDIQTNVTTTDNPDSTTLSCGLTNTTNPTDRLTSTTTSFRGYSAPVQKNKNRKARPCPYSCHPRITAISDPWL